MQSSKKSTDSSPDFAKLIKDLLRIVEPQFRLDINDGCHGRSHWVRVWRNARELCEAENIDPKIPCIFSFIHDSQRVNDGIDSEHGTRAAEWFHNLASSQQLPFEITSEELVILEVALCYHSDGRTVAHPIVQVCWDADRLDLGRVGIMPDPAYLCTAHAKNPDTIKRAWDRSLPR